MHHVIQKVVVSLALFTCLSTDLLAQSFFDFNKRTAPSSPPSTVLSPEQFSSTVNQMGQTTKNSINQQATQQFIKQPLPPSSTMAAPPTMNTPMTNETTSTPVPPPQQYNVPAPTQSPSGYSGTYSAPPAPTVAPAPPPPPTNYGTQNLPSQNQPYTGFGTTPPTNNRGTTTNASPGNSTSGGWNIKY